MEKRACKRHFREAHLRCAYFNTNKYCQAKMLNYCEGGLYLESQFGFKPKSTIHIRIEELSHKTSDSHMHYGFRSATLGEVKWCKEISSAEPCKYGIGIRYYHPY